MNFKNKNILITGGHGFLGRHLCLNFKANGYKRIFTPNHKEYDLTRDSHVRRMISSIKPYVIIHCAALVGGIGANQEKPGSFFYNNAIMGIGLMEESRKSGVNKFVCIGTVCGYPKRTPVPFKEEYFWNGYPEETNAPYGLAKKMLLVQSQAYRAQYGFNSIYLIPVNMYGPRDNFDLHSSHVIPALIRKFYEAKKMNKKNVAIWGNGSASR
jgi:GDP-L-fucose synthase